MKIAGQTSRKVLLEAARSRGTKRAPDGLQVFKEYAGTVQPVGARSFRFTLSTATVYRAGDVLNQDGWELSAYRRSPVVLWMHDHRLPIGRGIDVRVEGGRLKGTAVLDPSETPVTGAFAEMCRMKLAAGSLLACSVGFQQISFDMSNRLNELIEFDFISNPWSSFQLSQRLVILKLWLTIRMTYKPRWLPWSMRPRRVAPAR